LGDALDFDNADTCFEIIGTPVTFAAGDAIALGSTQSDGNSPYCKKTTCVVSGVTEPGTLRDYTGAAGAQLVVKMAGAAQFFTSTELEGHRFEVVPAGLPVTYACTGALALDVNGDGLGSLTRYSGYAISETQKAPAALGAGSILANNVSDCHFVYVTTNMSNSLLAIRLRITRGGENVNLYHEIHVNNIP
jgi:MSHA biogenesis protein MshO